MSDSSSQIAAITVVALVALVMVGAQLVSIVRDSDAWVIVRGVARGRFDRIRRRIKPRRG